MTKNQFYGIMSMIAFSIALMAFLTVLKPEKVTSGIDDLIWTAARVVVLVFWGIALLLNKKGIFDNYLLMISTATIFTGIMIKQITVPQIPLLMYIFATALLIYEDDISRLIKKYNEHKELSNDVFTTLIVISFATLVITFVITNPAIVLSIIIMAILLAMSWDLVS